MKITVKSSSRAYKVPVRVLKSDDFDDHYDVMEPAEADCDNS